MYTDTHLHLDRREFAGEIDAVLARAQAAGVTRLIN
ncbi:LuxR family transcriptional regulator, partial [bacterium]|nr:LuxR family transcriptional regulator [bacterium]